MELWTMIPFLLYLTIHFCDASLRKSGSQGNTAAKVKQDAGKPHKPEIGVRDVAIESEEIPSIEYHPVVEEKHLLRKIPTLSTNRHAVTKQESKLKEEKKNPVYTLAEKREYMRHFLNIPYTWTGFDNNFDAFLTALGIGIIKRTALMRLSLVETLSENKDRDGDWDYKFTMKVRHERDSQFKLGVPVEYTTREGRKVRSVFNLVDRNVLLEDQTILKTGKRVVYSREYSKDRMLLTATVDDIPTVQTFTVEPQ